MLLQVIPRVNPLLAPNASYVSEDRSRLLLRLDMYGLDERPVGGDGNCQVGRSGRQAAVHATAGCHLRGACRQQHLLWAQEEPACSKSLLVKHSATLAKQQATAAGHIWLDSSRRVA